MVSKTSIGLFYLGEKGVVMHSMMVHELNTKLRNNKKSYNRDSSNPLDPIISRQESNTR